MFSSSSQPRPGCRFDIGIDAFLHAFFNPQSHQPMILESIIHKSQFIALAWIQKHHWHDWLTILSVTTTQNSKPQTPKPIHSCREQDWSSNPFIGLGNPSSGSSIHWLSGYQTYGFAAAFRLFFVYLYLIGNLLVAHEETLWVLHLVFSISDRSDKAGTHGWDIPQVLRIVTPFQYRYSESSTPCDWYAVTWWEL